MKKLLFAVLFLASPLWATSTARLGLNKIDDGVTPWGQAVRDNYDLIDSSVAVQTKQNSFSAYNTFTSSVSISSATFYQVRISTPSYSGSQPFVTNGAAKFFGSTGANVSLCDSNGLNCGTMTNQFGTEIRFGGTISAENATAVNLGSKIRFLGTGNGATAGDGLNSSMSCTQGNTCLFFQDNLSGPNIGSGSLFHTYNLSRIEGTNQNGQIMGALAEFSTIKSSQVLSSGAIGQVAKGMIGHLVNPTFSNFSTSGSTQTAIYAIPVSSLSVKDIVYGVQSDMSMVTSTSAIKVSGRFYDGRFEIIGSTQNIYSVLIGTSPSMSDTNYHVAITTGGVLSPMKGILGTATNDNASVGNYGEYVSSITSTVTNFPASGNSGDIATITLTAGDWDVSSMVVASAGGATVTRFDTGISTTSGNSMSGLTYGYNQTESLGPTAATFETATIPPFRMSVSGSTNVFLKYQAVYTVATPQAQARLSARRVR